MGSPPPDFLLSAPLSESVREKARPCNLNHFSFSALLATAAERGKPGWRRLTQTAEVKAGDYLWIATIGSPRPISTESVAFELAVTQGARGLAFPSAPSFFPPDAQGR